MTPRLSGRSFGLCALVLAASSVTACGPDYDKEVAKVLALTGDPVAGEDVFNDPTDDNAVDCESCHGSAGEGKPAFDYPAIDDFDEQCEDNFIARLVLTGKDEMPSFYGKLSDQQIADVVALVKTLEPNACPPAEANTVVDPPL